jgi:hypothetical protein
LVVESIQGFGGKIPDLWRNSRQISMSKESTMATRHRDQIRRAIACPQGKPVTLIGTNRVTKIQTVDANKEDVRSRQVRKLYSRAR